MHKSFQKPLKIIKTLQEHGFEAYFVGGSVRDLLLNRSIGDIDIATNALPKEIIKIFNRTIDVGAKHGTIIVHHENEAYEVTTFRLESQYVDFRRPDEVTFINSLQEDLKRRDFTMNAIAMSSDEKIIDPYRGQDALKNKLIETVGNPKDRFGEDALRMMRAIRFVSQLSFSLEEQTRLAISQYSHLLKEISIERITVEFEKTLLGNNPKSAFELMIDTKIFHYLPGLEDKENELKQITKYNLHHLRNREEWWLLLLIVLKIDDVKDFLKRWKLPNKVIKTIEKASGIFLLVKNQGWNKKILFQAGIENAIAVERIWAVLHNEEPTKKVANIEIAYQELPIKTRNEIPINGNDLIEFFQKKPGPWVADILQRIENHIINNEIDLDRDAIREWLQSCNLK
ncbi:CCA tRNA nucleotidyltransferase [Bacillus timonensis]|nr:CCA tRNA nucleotidyltransferase [Bacillus timonensis]